MTLVIKTTTRFDRMLKSFLKYHPNLKDKTKSLMVNLSNDYKNTKLKAHKLGGVFKNCYSASINFKYRIIFYLTDDQIWFISIGSHDEVYG